MVPSHSSSNMGKLSDIPLPPPPPPPPLVAPPSSPSNDNDDDDGGGGGPAWEESSSTRWWAATIPALLPLPSMAKQALKASLTVTLLLYVLNQKHMLPRPLSALVSKVLFWPTLPITVCRRRLNGGGRGSTGTAAGTAGGWLTVMDDTVILGGAPFGFWGLPDLLYHRYHVRGVINLCQEYHGPVRHYQRLGMEQLYLPTTDHFEPSVIDLESAVHFIARYRKQGDMVYVHCRAGHGRSAAVVYAWLLFRQEQQQQQEYLSDATTTMTTRAVDKGSCSRLAHQDEIDLEALNQKMSRLRNVRTALWRQPNIRLFHQRLMINKSKKLQTIENKKNHLNDHEQDNVMVNDDDDKKEI